MKLEISSGNGDGNSIFQQHFFNATFTVNPAFSE